MNLEHIKKVDKERQYEVDKNGFVRFGDVAIGEIKQQAQYASRFINGEEGKIPKLGAGLRFEGDTTDNRNLKIHKDDIKEFVARVRAYKRSEMARFQSKELLPISEIADDLDALQKMKNNGRGVGCVQEIIAYLRQGDIGKAKAIAFHDHDKISGMGVLILT